MKLRYLTPLVLALVGGVAWSVQSYLEADRDLRVDLRLQRTELPVATPVAAPLFPTAQVLPAPGDRPASS